MLFEQSKLLEEIRDRRKVIIEAIIVASVIGFALNISSGALYEWLKDSQLIIDLTQMICKPTPHTTAKSSTNQDQPSQDKTPALAEQNPSGAADPTEKLSNAFTIFALSGVVLIFFIIVGVLLLLRHRISDTMFFRILLPIRITGNSVRIEPIKGYAPTKHACELLNKYLKRRPECANSLIALPNKNIQKEGSAKEPFFNYTLYHVICEILLRLIKEYSRHTLTSSSLYHPTYLPISWSLGSHKVNIEKEDGIEIGSEFVRRLRLPSATHLQYVESKVSPKTEIIQIKSPHCCLELEVLPHWSKITPRNTRKTYKAAIRKIADTKDLLLLAIPVKGSIRVGRISILFRKSTEDYYYWMFGLLRDAERWLSWELYQNQDIERMVIEIHQKLIQRQ